MNRHKEFLLYVLPSVLAFALSGVYAIVDGFFVGNKIGDIGLSTINVAYPAVMLLQALGTGIGMGGAVNYSVHKATGNKNDSDSCISGTVIMLLAASAVITAVFYIFTEPVLVLLGARDELLAYGIKYLKVISIGAVFQIFSTGIVPLIRNYGGAIFSMVSMMAGFFANVFLDYMFVWRLEFGVEGAAAATLAGQAITMVCGIFYLAVKKAPLFTKKISRLGKNMVMITKVGIAPFGVSLSGMFAAVFMNRFCIANGGEVAVATYAVVAYVTWILYLMLQGTGDGAQPLMSRYYGEGCRDMLKFVRKMAYITAIVLAVAGDILLYAVKEEVGVLFGASNEVIAETVRAMVPFIVGIIFLAYMRITTAYFYATMKNIFAYIVVYTEPVMLFVLLNILPRFMGLSGVWWSVAGSQFAGAAAAVCLRLLAEKTEVVK